ncbi:hypothetical protein K449DRAFT_23656 [Hypoxylon sp. EC38]|nr:hypothetical protein K449DRAFT_23656 [Hypoxylon sp. EC38]
MQKASVTKIILVGYLEMQIRSRPNPVLFLRFFLGFLLGSLSLGSRLVLLRGRSRLEALESLLVGLALCDGSGKLLSLGDLQLKLLNPVVTVGSGRCLESVLVTLGSEGELVGTLDGGFRSLSLQCALVMVDNHPRIIHTNWIAPVGVALSLSLP